MAFLNRLSNGRWLPQFRASKSMIPPYSKLLETGAAGLGQLFEEERDHLRRFLQRRINGKLSSRIDASDVIQEVYLRAQAALPNYLSNPVVPPLTWLRHLSFQVLCEVHRKQFWQTT